MDKLDLNLLKNLTYNARTPITQLAKKLKVSREVVTYRLKKLKRGEVILDFVTEGDIEKLGYVSAAVFVNVKATKQKAFEQYLKESPFVSWVAELSGIWSFGFSISAKTNKELDEHFLRMYQLFKEDIIDHRFTLHKNSLFFYEKYFGELETKKEKKKKKTDYKIDKKDKIILRELTKNARTDCVALANKISLTAPATAQRIKHLETSGFIKKHTMFIDLRKLGLCQYSIFVINKNIDEEKKLLQYLKEHKNISFIAEYVGDPFIEFGLFVHNPYELREKLQVIEEAFPNNRVIEVSLFQKEFVSVGPPACVFE